MAKLAPSEMEEKLRSLSGWKLEARQLTKQFEFSSFPDLISFVVKVAFLAETADHHPDMTINYRRLTFHLSTHDEDGITEKDFALAKQIEAALNRY
jgi:4a-hydroxytetrahydrobiopterin dehydratase